MSTSLVTGKVRLSYVNLFEPRAPLNGGDPKYSVTVMLPKTDAATYQIIQAALNEATQDGVAKKWGGRMPAKLDVPIHDGDGVRPNGEPFGEECRGCWVFTASGKQQPGIVDQRVQPILDSTQVYSGIYAHVDVNFYPYDAAGKRGIGIGLNNVQKVADGEALSGRRAASAVFAPVADAGAAFQPQQPTQAYRPQPQQPQPQPGVQNYPGML